MGEAGLGVDGGGSKHAPAGRRAARGAWVGLQRPLQLGGHRAGGGRGRPHRGGQRRPGRRPVRSTDASAFGLAGLDWDSDRPILGGLLDFGLAGPRTLDNDSFIALRAGASPAGRGGGDRRSAVAVAAGRDAAGRTFRTFGLGPMYGDPRQRD